MSNSTPRFMPVPFTTTNTIEVQAFATDQNFDEFTPAITGLIQFVPSQTITDTTPGGGTVSLNPPGGVYGSGTVVTLTANAAPGWTFANWTGGVSGTNPVLAVTLTNNLTIAAVFVTTVAMSAGTGKLRLGGGQLRRAACILTERPWTFPPCPIRESISCAGRTPTLARPARSPSP